jgi:hypothetical protein
MSIAHDLTSSGSNSFASSITFAAPTSGSDKFLSVGPVTRNNAVSPTSVTHNGDALTVVGSVQSASAMSVSFYGRVNPNATGNIVINLAASNNILGIGNSYTGVHQTTPLGTEQVDIQDGTGGSTNSVTLSSALGELCIDVSGNRNGDTPTIPGDQTVRGSVDSASQINGAMSEEAGAASVVMGRSIVTGSIERTLIAVPLKPSGAAAFQAAWTRNSNQIIGAYQ